MVDWTDFICGMNMCIHLPYKFVQYFAHIAYLPNLVHIFVFSIYFAIPREVCTVVGCVLAHICKNVGAICPVNLLVV